MVALASFCVAAMGFFDALCFLWREKPWKYQRRMSDIMLTARSSVDRTPRDLESGAGRQNSSASNRYPEAWLLSVAAAGQTDAPRRASAASNSPSHASAGSGAVPASNAGSAAPSSVVPPGAGTPGALTPALRAQLSDVGDGWRHVSARRRALQRLALEQLDRMTPEGALHDGGDRGNLPPMMLMPSASQSRLRGRQATIGVNGVGAERNW
jgi:hypothetical protein